MIKKLIVSNYRSIGPDIHIQPGTLSILIGPNGAGKSNILDFLSFIRDAVVQGLPAAITHRGGIDSVRRVSHGQPFDVKMHIELKLKHGYSGYTFVITGDRLEEYKVKSEKAWVRNQEEVSKFNRIGNNWEGTEGLAPRIDEQSLALTVLGGTKQFKPLVDFLSRINVYSIFPDTLRVPQKSDSTHSMKGHGENWVAILSKLIKHKDAKNDLVAGLKKLTGDIEDVRVTRAAGYLIAEFKQQIKAQKDKHWFGAAQQSDGTLRVAGLLTALLQTPELTLIGIEEPELTVHPGALPMLYDYLLQASELSQIILTTHSPIILDVINPAKDTIFVVSKTDGKTSVKKMTDELLEPVRKKLLQLGDLFISGDLQLSLFDELEEE